MLLEAFGWKRWAGAMPSVDHQARNILHDLEFAYIGIEGLKPVDSGRPDREYVEKAFRWIIRCRAMTLWISLGRPALRRLPQRLFQRCFRRQESPVLGIRLHNIT